MNFSIRATIAKKWLWSCVVALSAVCCSQFTSGHHRGGVWVSTTLAAAVIRTSMLVYPSTQLQSDSKHSQMKYRGLLDGLSWVTDVTGRARDFWRLGWRDFFVPSVLLSTFIHFFLTSSPLSLIVLFQSCCSHAQVFGGTLVHEFLFSYSHTEWNLLFLKQTPLWHEATWDKPEASIKTETEEEEEMKYKTKYSNIVRTIRIRYFLIS